MNYPRRLMNFFKRKVFPTGVPATQEIRSSHPNGHFYSPVVNPRELIVDQESLWPPVPAEVAGVDFNEDSHRVILKEWFPRHVGLYDYPERLESGISDSRTFYTCNSQFSWLDARVLFVILNELKPGKVIEVGSGFSSLLMADVNRRFLNSRCEISCVEPYPRDFLVDGVEGISRLIQEKVQNVSVALFSTLRAGDVLFIDSSHVCKTGSDVNFLYFEVLPILPPGVLVHIHDVFLPFDYPKEWVLDENRSWNEQYLLRALLMYSERFQIRFGSNFAFHRFRDEVVSALNLPNGQGFGGGSLWLQVL